MSRSLAFSLMLVLLCFSCATTPEQRNYGFTQLKIGMDKEEVRRLLGSPVKEEETPRYLSLYYNDGTVRLQSNSVAWWGHNLKMSSHEYIEESFDFDQKPTVKKAFILLANKKGNNQLIFNENRNLIAKSLEVNGYEIVEKDIESTVIVKVDFKSSPHDTEDKIALTLINHFECDDYLKIETCRTVYGGQSARNYPNASYDLSYEASGILSKSFLENGNIIEIWKTISIIRSPSDNIRLFLPKLIFLSLNQIEKNIQRSKKFLYGYSSSEELFTTGNHPEVSLLETCDKGGMQACSRLGSIESKKGNKAEAKRLQMKACEGGNMDGCYITGFVEDQDGNKAEAKRLFAMACEGGLMRGCYAAGFVEDQNGNKTEAKRLFAKACGGGNMKGCYAAGSIELENDNDAEAKRLYIEACDGGNMGGCNLAGYIEYARKKPDRAIKLFEKACENGEADGCNNLGRIEKKNGDIIRAKMFFSRSCDEKNKWGCRNLGDIEKKNGNIAKAKQLYTKSCDLGENIGCANLKYENGNIKESMEIYINACNDGDNEGCEKVGFIEKGRGNLVSAKKWLSLACESEAIHGWGEHKDACRMLRKLAKSK
ncbi:MAG: SEL1-like repeat protein [Oligoflexia bacterium]|nr:SEL1-like repeat protein [Oligoflexia bacterium]